VIEGKLLNSIALPDVSKITAHADIGTWVIKFTRKNILLMDILIFPQDSLCRSIERTDN